MLKEICFPLVAALHCKSCHSNSSECQLNKCQPGYDTCANITYNFNLESGQASRNFAAWRAGCAKQDHCSATSADLCQLSRRALEGFDLDVSVFLSDCQIECYDGEKKDDGGDKQSTDTQNVDDQNVDQNSDRDDGDEKIDDSEKDNGDKEISDTQDEDNSDTVDDVNTNDDTIDSTQVIADQQTDSTSDVTVTQDGESINDDGDDDSGENNRDDTKSAPEPNINQGKTALLFLLIRVQCLSLDVIAEFFDPSLVRPNVTRHALSFLKLICSFQMWIASLLSLRALRQI